MVNTSMNQLVYELLELRRAYIKDTDPIDRRLVIDWVQTQRAGLLKEKFDQPLYSIDDNLVQDLGTVPMTKVLSNIIGIIPPIASYDYMYRTSIEIPRTIMRKEGIGTFVRVGPADRLSNRFDIVKHEDALSLGYGKFNYNSIYAFVLGDYLYLQSNSGIHFTVKYLDVRGVFQDAIAAARIKTPAWTYNDDYPINKELVDQLKALIIARKFNLTLVQAGDKTDNKEDNPEGNVNVPKRQTQDTGEL